MNQDKQSEVSERVYGALRWLYKNGVQTDHTRPQWVSEIFDEAYASYRIAQPDAPPPRAAGMDTRPSPSTPSEGVIERLRALLAMATPGPWRFVENTGVIYRYGDPREVGSVRICRVGDYQDKELLPLSKERWDADAQLIELLRNNAEALARLSPLPLVEDES